MTIEDTITNEELDILQTQWNQKELEERARLEEAEWQSLMQQERSENDEK